MITAPQMQDGRQRCTSAMRPACGRCLGALLASSVEHGAGVTHKSLAASSLCPTCSTAPAPRIVRGFPLEDHASVTAFLPVDHGCWRHTPRSSARPPLTAPAGHARGASWVTAVALRSSTPSGQGGEPARDHPALTQRKFAVQGRRTAHSDAVGRNRKQGVARLAISAIG